MFIQKIYVLFMGRLIRSLGNFVKTDDNLVLFVSFMGKGFNDSPKCIFDYMMSHSEYHKYRCVWAFENPKQYSILNSIKIDSVKYFYTALKAKYWITNTNIERGLRFKKSNTVYLNTWHGIALKKIGNDCPGRKDYNFDSVNYLVVSGDYDERIFKSAFNASSKSFLKCGMPRNDALWNPQCMDKVQIRQKIGIENNKKIILYAPTWRESNDSGKSYLIKPPINFDKWESVLANEYIILFRAHTITTQVMGIKFNDFVRDVSNYQDVNELMVVSDMLVTDYSAIAFDYSILGKPILCFAYDYDTYLADRGTYFDINEFYPNPLCRDEEELLIRICEIDYEKESRNSKDFRSKFVMHGGKGTEICVRKVFEN